MNSIMIALFQRIIRKPACPIIVLASFQVLSSTYLLRLEWFGAANSLLFLLTGIAISYLILQIPSLTIEKRAIINKPFWVKLGVIILLLPFSYMTAAGIMDHTPIEKEYADMLPVMKTMGTRFINGHWSSVYDPIPEIWNGTQPIYLPAMWLPFTFALTFDFDMRWITVCGIWLSIILCVWPGIWKRNGWYVLYALALLTLLSWLHFDEVNNVIRLTEEGVVFFFYSLMVIAIISGNPWLVGISAALCLLSRYAIIGWIPFAGLYLLMTGQYRYLLKTVVAGAIVLLLLLILPFGWRPLLLHLDVPNQYIAHASRIWQENSDYFFHSPGMAKFFGPGNERMLHFILVGGSFLIPLSLLAFVRKKKIPRSIVLLAGFQLSITFFYCFLDVSYLYLYYTPVFVSLVIGGWAMAACKHP